MSDGIENTIGWGEGSDNNTIGWGQAQEAWCEITPPTPPPVGATLMKTGQTTSYRTGDDGDLEAGRATSFTVLASNNPFGNTNRFTNELGGQTYTNNIVIDWSTYNGSNVLGYYIGSLGVNRVFDAAIDWGLNLSVGLFTSGWRLLNRKELDNILWDGGISIADNLNYNPFNIGTINIGTSTNYSTTWINRATTGGVVTTSKTTALRTIAVRTFTVTGTTLT
jgi:hypothetical protein